MRHTIRNLGLSGYLIATSAFAPAVATAQSNSRIVLEPSSGWQASYETGLCRLTRIFANDSGLHALVFEQRAPGATFNLIVTGPALSGIVESSNVRVDFGPDGLSAEHPVVKAANPKFDALMFVQDVGIVADEPDAGSGTASIGMAASLNAIDTAAAKTLRQITIGQGQQAFVFATGALAAPFGVLNDCTSHILETWGLDPEAHRTAQRRADMLDKQRVARGINDYYPPRAAAERRQGVVGVAVMVDETGAPTDCKITHDSGHDDLNSVTCRQLMKARFDPALGADGLAMKSYWVTRITFRLG